MDKSTVNNKNRNINFYLYKIEELEWVKFDCLRVISASGEYYWLAITKLRPSEDKPYGGTGRTPLEAIRNLYKILKEVMANHSDTIEGF